MVKRVPVPISTRGTAKKLIIIFFYNSLFVKKGLILFLGVVVFIIKRITIIIDFFVFFTFE